MGINNYKKLFRQKALERRDKSKDIKTDNQVISRFINSPYYRKAKSLMLTSSIGSEIETAGLIKQALKDRKKVYLPVTDKENKRLIPVEIKSFSGPFKKGAYGIIEPVLEPGFLPDSGPIDLIVVPGLAFDEKGNRIGYGGGYYDRFLENSKAFSAALAREEQIMEDIPLEPHDYPVDLVITQNRIIKTGA